MGLLGQGMSAGRALVAAHRSTVTGWAGRSIVAIIEALAVAHIYGLTSATLMGSASTVIDT